MAIVNPVATIRWQCTSESGLLSGEVDTRVTHGYRKKVIAEVKKHIREKYPNRVSNQWTISLFGEDGRGIGKWEVKI